MTGVSVFDGQTQQLLDYLVATYTTKIHTCTKSCAVTSSLIPTLRTCKMHDSSVWNPSSWVGVLNHIAIANHSRTCQSPCWASLRAVWIVENRHKTRFKVNRYSTELILGNHASSGCHSWCCLLGIFLTAIKHVRAGHDVSMRKHVPYWRACDQLGIVSAIKNTQSRSA